MLLKCIEIDDNVFIANIGLSLKCKYIYLIKVLFI